MRVLCICAGNTGGGINQEKVSALLQHLSMSGLFVLRICVGWGGKGPKTSHIRQQAPSCRLVSVSVPNLLML